MAQPRANVAKAVKAGSGIARAGNAPKVPQVSQKGARPAGWAPAASAATNASAGTNVPPAGPPSNPWDTDAISQGKFANAAANYANATAYDASNRLSTVNHYGWNTVGPNGESIEAVYSPYSIASLLQRSHENNRNRATEGAGLSLYSGSTINHLGEADFQFGKEYSDDREAFSGALGKIGQEEQAASEAKQQAEEEGREGAVERQKEEPDPEVPEHVNKGVLGTTKYKGKKKVIGIGGGKKA